MKKIPLISVLAAISLAAAAGAAEMSIPSIDNSESVRQITLPAVRPGEGERVQLNFTACILREKPRGWANILERRINGKKVAEQDEAGNLRLVNKGKTFVSRSGSRESKVAWWYQGTRLLVFYGSGTGSADGRAQLDENAWKYALDVTDLITAGKPVLLKGINHLYRNWVRCDAVIQLKDIELKIVPSQK